jgi:hypothetical protein
MAAVLYPGGISHGWIALAAAVPMTQWAHQVLQMALLTRDERARLLLILTAVIAILILLVDLGGRIARSLRRRRRTPLAPGTQEGAGP